MAKIAIVVNKFLRDIYTSTEKPANTYEKYLHMLEDWSSALPPNLRYFPNHPAGKTKPNFATKDELSSLYLEMFYLAAVLVLTRPLLLRDVRSRSTRGASTLALNLRVFAQTCTDAAIQIGHVSAQMVPQGFICKKSWLASTIIYHACLVLLLDLSVRESHVRWSLNSAQEQTRYQLKKQGLQSCIEVLSYCATNSAEAQRLVETVKIFQRLLGGQEPPTFDLLQENFLPAFTQPDSSSVPSSSSWYGNLSAMNFTDQSALRSSSSHGSEGMAGTDLGTLAAFSSRSSCESALPSDSSFSTTYSLDKACGDMSRLLYGTGLEFSGADQSGQLPVTPQHFQGFLRRIPNYQDHQEAYQYQDSSFGTG
ncbi:hypothetical protein LTR70_009890 [Exophiala xenobiotica]|uniref:Transcription factor domain-containing protein n=1 Tax=Lithohypha guttulata TaxID=1690604 RepID=A0ABR0JTW1_9EURO|nr:hypothetical protein LTR24_010480 [Lithohypha guttulata]KAK5309909.1 hypothetical protein LTR70_009890 [Exophiala xenobiotica]